MADATTIVTLPTNVQWPHCGPPDPEVKKLLESLNKKARKSRIEWLKELCKPLPTGPFPIHVEGRGWFKGHIMKPARYQACLVMRKDLNLDVRVFEIIRDQITGLAVDRVQCEEDRIIPICVCKEELWAAYKELHPQVFKKITTVWEYAEIAVGTLQAFIMREGELWKEYDVEVNENIKLMKKVHAGPAQCDVICRGVADDEVILKAMRRDDKARAEASVSTSKHRRAKRCLPFTEKYGPKVDAPPKSKRPKVRFVSKLDKAEAGLDAVNKKVGQTLWLVRKLEDDKAFRKILARKSKKIAGCIFKLLPREDLENLAVKLAQNCTQDSLADVLQGYREQALVAVKK